MPVTLERPIAMDEPSDRMWTTEEVAYCLQFSIKKVQHLASSGQLQGYKIAGEWRFWKKDVDAFIEQHRQRKDSA